MIENMYFKKSTQLFITIVFILINSSCKKPEGQGTSPEFPEPKEVSSSENTFELNAKNNVGWSVTEIIIDGDLISLDKWKTYPHLKFKYNVEAGRYADIPHLIGIYHIEYDWFTWDKVDEKTMKIMVKKNDSKKKRTIIFKIRSGNASQKVNIIQSE